MARQVNPGITKAKQLLVSRLQYLVLKELAVTSKSTLAVKLGVSKYTINRLCSGTSHHVSLDLMLNVAERLKLRYELSIQYDGKGERSYVVKLTPVHQGLASRLNDMLPGLFGPKLGELRA